MSKLCIGCGNKYESNYPQSKFCSKNCRYTPCVICHTPMYNPSRKRKLCSNNECKVTHLKNIMRGENNPNFGKKWSEDKKKIQSGIIKSTVNNEYRLKAGRANKGKNFSKDRIQKMHGHRTFESYSKPHNEETKKLIGKKSSAKFTEEYNLSFRKIMEENGVWIPINKKNDYEIYFLESNWLEPLYDIFYLQKHPLLIEHGIFNAYKNTRGVVRDHCFSRRSGFEKGVFPVIMRHIENCEIILHSDNVKKNVSKSKNSDSITIEILIEKIKSTNYNWQEQEECLQFIKEYENGKRWKRKEVKCVSENE